MVVASGWRANCDSVRINDLLAQSLLILWYARPADVSWYGDAEEGLCGQYHSGEGGESGLSDGAASCRRTGGKLYRSDPAYLAGRRKSATGSNAGQVARSRESHKAQVRKRTKCVRRRWSNRAVGEKRRLDEAGLRWSQYPRA